MSITKITSPSNWARVNDTNRMVYKFGSTNYIQPNFQYQFHLKVYFPEQDEDMFIDIGTFNVHPNTDGTGEFNPSDIYMSYISHDINLSITKTTELFESVKLFKLSVFEYYGTPPVKKNTGNWVEDGIICYNGCQQNIPYDYNTLNPKGNNRFVMDNTVPYQGQFLTDVNQYRLYNDDYCFIYALGGPTHGRPDRIRYRIRHFENISDIIDEEEQGINITDGMWFGGGRQTQGQQTTPISKPIIKVDKPTLVTPTGQVLVTTTKYDMNFNWTKPGTQGYYIPVGPKQLLNNNILTTTIKTWMYYDIDIMSGSIVLNDQPFRVIKNKNDNKYGKWQVFWLNPHGGFDTFVFDKKNELNYKIKRDTYKIKLGPIYSTYEAGERVFNTEVTEEITLRSKLLTQMEAQMLTQLAQSPVVYVVMTYQNGLTSIPYGVPYIVVNDKIKYEQKVNDKEITMEITLRPSNQRVVQRN